jgi:hypothetical protein
LAGEYRLRLFIGKIRLPSLPCRGSAARAGIRWGRLAPSVEGALGWLPPCSGVKRWLGEVHSGVAQLVEQTAVNRRVGGSSPSSGVKSAD